MRAALFLGALAACVPAVRTVERPVAELVRARIGADLDADTSTLLERPLTRAAAIQLAIAHHPRAAAARATLATAVGPAAAAGSLGHTELDLEYLTYGTDPGVDLAVVHDVMPLLLALPRRAAADAIVEAAQARAAAELIALAARAELAWLDAAGAAAELRIVRDGFDAVDAAAELTGRLRASGGTTELARARADGQRELARLELARAEVAVERTRTAVDAALGLSGRATQWRLGDALPEVPAAPPAADDLEAAAVAASLALRAADADERAAGNAARVAAVGAWLPSLAIGPVASRHHGSWTYGTAVHLGLPLVSGERAEAAAARARGRAAAATTEAIAIELRAAARGARLEALAAHAEARHLADVVVPLTRRIVEETVLQYNAMNASPFELLSARRDQARAEQALIAARVRLARAAVVVAALRAGVAIELAPSTAVAMPSSPHAGGSHASP